MFLRLTGGPYSLDLAPEIGGAVSGAWFETGGRRIEILRRATPDLSDPTQAGCFPMAPFCNRLRRGLIKFQGRTIRLAPNHRDEPHPLHGLAWLAPWQVKDSGPDYATLVWRHEAGDWPWSFIVRQVFRLTGLGIEICLSIQNFDHSSMPAGLGLHPYFPSTDDVQILTKVESVMLTDAQGLATGELAPATLDFSLENRVIFQSGLDHGFTEWSSDLEVVYPDHKVRMTASNTANWLQVYAPKGQDYFCAEPATHANDAFASPEDNWSSLGLKVLQPGETLALSMVLQCQA